MRNSGKILFLTLNTFSSTGGIEDVCKTFCKVLSDMSRSFMVFSMNDYNPDPAFINPANFKGYGRNKFKFGCNAIAEGLRSDVIILSHVNLLLFARIIKFLSPSKRIVAYAHGIEVWREMSNWKIKFLRTNTEIWAVSRYTARELQRRHKIPAENIFILNNCLNPFFEPPKNFQKPASLLRKYRINPDQPVLFTLTRISDSEKYKGYDIVINVLPELISKYPTLQYIISGKADSKERDRLVTRIKEQGLQNHVFLTGFVDYAELSDHFLMADCFVLPSKKEGFGIVFIESAACGCKVLAGNKDGSPDALLDGELGTLIDPDDRRAVLNALLTILETPNTTADSIKIQKKCLEHFSYSRYKEKVKDLLLQNN